ARHAAPHLRPQDARARARGRASAHAPGGRHMNERPPIVVFCERLENEHVCESVVRELGDYYEVRACGPGWPARDLKDVDTRGARFYLELDSVSGNFDRPTGLAELRLPKFAWLVDTHKK